jgi:hypothetical protein
MGDLGELVPQICVTPEETGAANLPADQGSRYLPVYISELLVALPSIFILSKLPRPKEHSIGSCLWVAKNPAFVPWDTPFNVFVDSG